MVRKLALVGVAVLFETGGVVQLTYGLLVCFVSFGLLARLAPYELDDIDRLAQLCQLQIFVTLVAKVILEADLADVHGMDILLVAFTIINFNLAVYFETPLPMVVAILRVRLSGCLFGTNDENSRERDPEQSSAVGPVPPSIAHGVSGSSDETSTSTDVKGEAATMARLQRERVERARSAHNDAVRLNKHVSTHI
jgi:hypothetical protein